MVYLDACFDAWPYNPLSISGHFLSQTDISELPYLHTREQLSQLNRKSSWHQACS